MDTKFADAAANRLHVARIAQCEAMYTARNFRLRPGISQPESHSEKVPVSRASIIYQL